MPLVTAALVNLNHPGHYIHWRFVEISVANLLVVGLMLAVFVLALVLPFPHGHSSRQRRPARPLPSAKEHDSGGETTR